MSGNTKDSRIVGLQPSRRWGSRIVVVLFAAVAVPLGVTLLYNFAPTDSANSWYPGCTFQRVTGWHCPGCGATRCCHALVHGDFAQAVAWNPLFVLLLPILLLSAFQIGYTMWTGQPAPGRRMPGWAVKCLVGVLIVFWIARNIPAEPFTLLAPHKTEATREREQQLQDETSEQ